MDANVMSTGVSIATGSSAVKPVRRGRAAGRLAGMALAAATALGGIAITSLPAAAATYRNAGSPGSTGISQTAGGYVFETINQYLDSGPVVAHRSAASNGTQLITIRWRIWSWEYPNWQLLGNRTGSITYTAYPGQYVAFNGFRSNFMPSGIFSTDIKITWQTTGGTVLGSRFYDLVHQGDYTCWSSFTFCDVTTAGGQWTIRLT